MQQKTLKKQVVFNGYGIHTGKFAEVTMSPLKEDSGIIFRSSTLTSKYFAPYVNGHARGSEIVFADGSTIQTIEHLVSALAGLGVDNALVEVDGDEAPIKDGSAQFVVEQILSVGLLEQKREKTFFQLREPKFLAEQDKFILAVPAEKFQVNFLMDYAHPQVGADIFQFTWGEDDYAKEIAPARTFGFKEEIDYLAKNDLAKGAALHNAIVIAPEGFSTPLRFPDELVRHKVMDFIGDIMAVGDLPLAEFFVCKSGHSFNHKFVKMLLENNA